MNEAPSIEAPPQRKLWVRVLLMLLFGAAFQLAAWVLVAVALLQLIVVVATGETNARLRWLARTLGMYLSQIADFVGFETETAPFPFNDWPKVDERPQP